GPVRVLPPVLLRVLLHPVVLRRAEAVDPRTQVGGHAPTVVRVTRGRSQPALLLLDPHLLLVGAVGVRDADVVAELLLEGLVQLLEILRSIRAHVFTRGPGQLIHLRHRDLAVVVATPAAGRGLAVPVIPGTGAAATTAAARLADPQDGAHTATDDVDRASDDVLDLPGDRVIDLPAGHPREPHVRLVTTIGQTLGTIGRDLPLLVEVHRGFTRRAQGGLDHVLDDGLVRVLLDHEGQLRLDRVPVQTLALGVGQQHDGAVVGPLAQTDAAMVLARDVGEVPVPGRLLARADPVRLVEDALPRRGVHGTGFGGPVAQDARDVLLGHAPCLEHGVDRLGVRLLVGRDRAGLTTATDAAHRARHAVVMDRTSDRAAVQDAGEQSPGEHAAAHGHR